MMRLQAMSARRAGEELAKMGQEELAEALGGARRGQGPERVEEPAARALMAMTQAAGSGALPMALWRGLRRCPAPEELRAWLPPSQQDGWAEPVEGPWGGARILRGGEDIGALWLALPRLRAVSMGRLWASRPGGGLICRLRFEREFPEALLALEKAAEPGAWRSEAIVVARDKPDELGWAAEKREQTSERRRHKRV